MPSRRPPPVVLLPRYRAIAGMYADGVGMKQIALWLGVSLESVKTAVSVVRAWHKARGSSWVRRLLCGACC